MALALILVMMFTLCACGSKSGNNNNTSGSGNSGNGPTGFTYVSDYTPIENKSNNGYYANYCDETGFYCSVSEVVGKNIPEGKTEEYEGQYDVYETRLYKVGFDGSVERLSDYVPTTVESEHQSNSYIQNFCSDGNGGLIILECVNTSWNDAPEDMDEDDSDYWNYYKYEEAYYLRHLESSGKEISSALIGENNSDNNGSYFYAYDVETDKDGNVYMACDTEGVKVYDFEGNVRFAITTDGWIDSLVALPDGRVAAMQWGENGYEISVIDVDSHSFGEKFTVSNNAYALQPGGGDYDFYYTSGVNFYGCDMETGKEELLFNWIACDVDNDRIGSVYVDKDGVVYAISNSWDATWENLSSDIIKIYQVPANTVPEKQVITLATMYLDYNLRPFVIDFNRKSSTVRIDVREYNDINQLNTEIMAGNYPDIIDSNTIPLDRLAAKGLLEDLYPYIDKDSELDRNDFLPNVLAAAEVDGKLYSTLSSFSIQSVVGASSIVGDTPGWTYEDLYSAIANMPEGCTIFDNYFERSTVLRYCMYLEGNNLVDWTTGECNFDSRTFRAILEFANLFPEIFDWDNEEYVDSFEAIAEGKQMLLNAYFYSFEDVMQYPAIFNNDLTFIGFPTYDGVGNMMMLDNSYAMFSTCKDKEAAWYFLRTMFTKDYQKSCYDLPVNKELFEEKIAASMNPKYRTDDDGNFILDKNGDKIEEPKYTMGLANGDAIKIYSLSEEMAQAVREVVSSTTKILSNDEEIYEIVATESAPFFAGQKSADDVAKLIQNKVSIYVNEQR